MRLSNPIIALLLACFLPGVLVAETLKIQRVKVQELTVAELADTILQEGEVVRVIDEIDDDTSIVLRVGDGFTAGGQVVTDPWSMRFTTVRELSRDEYVVFGEGEASFSGGVWTLMPESTGAGNPSIYGKITIVSQHPLSGFEYDIQSQGVNITKLPARFLGGNVFTATLEARQHSPVPGPDLNFYAAVSNITVSAWTAPHLIGREYDIRQGKVYVRGQALTNLADNEPINKRVFNNRMRDLYGDDWWRYPALGDVRLDGWRASLTPRLSLRGLDEGQQWVYRTPAGIDRVVAHAHYASSTVSTNVTQTFDILKADMRDDIKIWISATVTFEDAPEIQWKPSLTDDSPWVGLSTTTAWPATENVTVGGNTYAAFKLETSRPMSDTAFFRVYGPFDEGFLVSDYYEYRVSDLRNTGTVTAERGFRVSDPSGSTNWVSGITADIPAAAVLHVVGGIIVGYTE